MSDAEVLDVRGLSCPQPALQSKQALKKMGSGTLEVLVDTKTSRDNVSRLAQKAKWDVTVAELPEGGFKLTITK